MAAMLENLSNIPVMSRTLISTVYRTAQIVASIPNLVYQDKARAPVLYLSLNSVRLWYNQSLYRFFLYPCYPSRFRLQMFCRLFPRHYSINYYWQWSAQIMKLELVLTAYFLLFSFHHPSAHVLMLLFPTPKSPLIFKGHSQELCQCSPHQQHFFRK